MADDKYTVLGNELRRKQQESRDERLKALNATYDHLVAKLPGHLRVPLDIRRPHGMPNGDVEKIQVNHESGAAAEIESTYSGGAVAMSVEGGARTYNIQNDDEFESFAGAIDAALSASLYAKYRF